MAAASPPDGIDRKLIDRIKGDENVQRILGVSCGQIRLSLCGPPAELDVNKEERGDVH
jgi:hypothetical protein